MVQVARRSLAIERWCLWSLLFHASFFFSCVLRLTALGDLLKLPTYLWVLAISNKIKLLRSSTKHFFFICFTVHSLYSCEPGVVHRFFFIIHSLYSCEPGVVQKVFFFICLICFAWMSSLGSCLGAYKCQCIKDGKASGTSLLWALLALHRCWPSYKRRLCRLPKPYKDHPS